MAMRFWNRRDAGPHCDFLSPLDSGESALVDDSWSQPRGGRDRRRSRAKNPGVTCDRGRRPRLHRRVAHTHSDTYTHAVAGNLGRDRTRTSPAFDARFCADADTGFLLERDLAHVRAGPDAILQGARAKWGRLA